MILFDIGLLRPDLFEMGFRWAKPPKNYHPYNPLSSETTATFAFAQNMSKSEISNITVIPGYMKSLVKYKFKTTYWNLHHYKYIIVPLGASAQS